MIKFFRRIRQQLITQNKVSQPERRSRVGNPPFGRAGKYLLYAIGEIVLVVIGILIALQINNWNEDKKELGKSLEIMREISENLAYNNQRFKQEIKEEESVINSIDIVRENLKFNKGYHDSLDFHFLNVAYWPGSIKKSSGYETLKSHGVEIIKSADLRKAIIDLYEGTYEQINEVGRTSENNVAVTMWPMFTELFETQPSVPNQAFKSLKVTPFDYDKVVKAQNYIGFLSWWRHTRVVSVELRMNAIGQNTVVLKMLSKELDD